MDEKDLELENNDAQKDEADAQENKTEQEVKYEENDNWQFDASAPTLENNIELGGGYQTDNLELPPQPAVSEKEEKSENITIRKKPLIIVLVSVLCAILIAVIVFFGIRFFTVPNSNERMNPGNVALTVGDTKISVGMYNFYYSSIVSNYVSYANYGYYDLDPTADYSTQTTVDKDGNEISWLDLFKKDTIDQIQYITAYYEAAKEAGITLTEEQQSKIDEQVKSLEDASSEAGQSIDAYIRQNYGDYCGIATIKKMLEQSYLAETYYHQAMITMTPTDEETNAYFEEHKGDYLSVSLASIEIAFSNGESEDNGLTVEEAEEKAKSYCESITNLDEMKAAIPEACGDIIEQYISYGYFENTEDAIKSISDSIEVTLTASDIKESYNEDIVAWAYDSENPIGSTTYMVDEDYGYVYVILKTSEPKLDETETYSVRHILVQPKAEEENTDTENANSSEQTEFTDEQWAAALEKANSILDEYNGGEKTQLSFALLAEEYSDDTESTSSGSSGIYGGAINGAKLGEMVPEFENWATDDARKYGDVEIVKSEYGYHIMYFVFDGPTYIYNASSDAQLEKENEFTEACKVKERSGLKKTKVATPVTTKAAQ